VLFDGHFAWLKIYNAGTGEANASRFTTIRVQQYKLLDWAPHHPPSGIYFFGLQPNFQEKGKFQILRENR